MTDPAARLRATTQELESHAAGPLWSLDPARERATPLVEVHAHTLAPLEPHLAHALAEPLALGLSELALAQLDAFPGNLFWDLDLIAALVVARAAGHADLDVARAAVADDFALMCELQHLYGRATPINFAYVHDFVYGFDWAKWVAREVAVQRDVPGPCSPIFLAYMRTRAHELLALIEADDSKYPALVDGTIRNPFPFSREPSAELRLHRELARRDLIPVPTWDAGAVTLDWSTRWRVPFQRLRVDVARELGLMHA
jgi:hypothetical protein